MAKLTQPEAADIILTAIRNYQRTHQVPPSMRELGELTHFSLAGLSYRLQRMEADGLIEREPRHARSIRVLEPDAW